MTKYVIKVGGKWYARYNLALDKWELLSAQKFATAYARRQTAEDCARSVEKQHPMFATEVIERAEPMRRVDTIQSKEL